MGRSQSGLARFGHRARNCAPNQQAWHWAGGYQSLIPLARTDLWAPKSLIPFESRCEFGVSGDR